MTISIMQSGNQPIQIPRRWFFPMHRMKNAIRGLVTEDGNNKINYSMETGSTRPYPLVYRDGESRPVGHYFREWGQWYPRFVLHNNDEALRQAVAPYVIFFQ